MKRVATVIRLRPEKEQEYRELHAAVWPDVLAALHRAHIRNYSIFLRDDLLFSPTTSTSATTCRPTWRDSPRTRRRSGGGG